MHIVWGIVWVIIGFLLVKYSFNIVQIFGKVTWAETHLGGGNGGTYTLWKIVGLIVIGLGFMYMFGSLNRLIQPLTGVFGG